MKLNFKAFSTINLNARKLNVNFSSTLNLIGCFEMTKLFKTIRYHFGSLDIHLIQNQKKQYFNLINSFVLFAYVQFLISSIAFLLFNVQTINEYVLSFYACITCFAGISFLLSTMIKRGNIFKLIENCEEAIERSRCQFFW